MRTENLIADTADLLTALRGATASAHQGLDAAFGSLDLTRREEQARFLAAHAIGLEGLFPAVRDFARDVLGFACPDYPAMLRSDLAELGVEIDLAAYAEGCDAAASSGTCYVVAGSRLGMTVIRRDGYWGRDNGKPSRYMEDEAGHGLWKALVPWLKSRRADAPESSAAVAAAASAFRAFERAFEQAGIVASASGIPADAARG
ncbi:MAG: heme oxygenase protein [Novosphingobium lindaniclasticum]|jgi:heme oxygenase|uniref:heme oxygenase n=1 Tax=Novosphingobium lindaniclasticum TaxID=1329895 RepID=UPI0024099061|nr:heme oxygenase [Novosphingobium lindaniclasticum]MDF2638067.1 heme oxygenase protein [Novosphingobium lindaniclasticum]